MEKAKENSRRRKISLAEFLKRLKVILPLVRMNPDLLIAVNQKD